MILNKKQIKDRLHISIPMVDNLKDEDTQLQPCGIDLTIKNIYEFSSYGTLDFDNSKRCISNKRNLDFVEGFNTYLDQGTYQIELNETFNIPNNIVGFTVSRSSLQRCGAAILQGCFDPGFSGKGFCLLNVYNKNGIVLYKDARIVQMIFHTTEDTEVYNGIYNEIQYT